MDSQAIKRLVGALIFLVVVLWFVQRQPAEEVSLQNEATSTVQDSSGTTTAPETDVAGSFDQEPVTSVTPVTPVAVQGVTLDMSNKGLQSVSMDTFKRSDLVALDLSHNNLTGALPAEVRHLQNLESLDLSHNQFTGVPAEVGQLSKLRHLDLSHNQLTGLPYELGNLKKLETLVLTGNNYAKQDLEVIREGLPATTRIVTE